MAWSSSLVIDAVAALVAVAGLAVCLPRCLRTVGVRRLPLPLILFAVGALLAWCSTELQSHAGGSDDASSAGIDDGGDNDDGTEGSAARWEAFRSAPVLQGLGAVHALRVASPQLSYWLLLPPIIFTMTASLPWASLQQLSNSGSCVGYLWAFPWAALGFAATGALVCGGAIAVVAKWLLPHSGEWSCAQAVALGACLAVPDPTAAVAVLRQRGAPSSRLPGLLEAEAALSLGAAALAFAAAAAGMSDQSLDRALPVASGSTSRSDGSGDWIYGDEDSFGEGALWVLRLLRLIVGGLICGLLALLFLWLVVAPLRRSSFSAAPMGSPLQDTTSGAHAGLTAAIACYGAFFAAEALLQASGVAAVVVLGLGVAHGAGLAPSSLAHSSGIISGGNNIGTFRRPGVGWAASLVPWTNGGANVNNSGARTLAVTLEWALYFAAGSASQRAFVRSTAGTEWLDFQGSAESENGIEPSLSALDLVVNAIFLMVVAIVFRGVALVLFNRVSTYRRGNQGSQLEGSQRGTNNDTSSSIGSWSTRELLAAWLGGIPRFGALAIALALQISQRTPSESYNSSSTSTSTSSSGQSEGGLQRQEFLLYVCGAVFLSHLAGSCGGLLLLESQTLWPYPAADKEAWARAAGLRRAVAKLEARTHGRKWAAQHRQALWGNPTQTGSSNGSEEGSKQKLAALSTLLLGEGGERGRSNDHDDDALALSLVPSFLGGDVRVRGDGAVSLLDQHGKPLVVDSATAVLNLFVRSKKDAIGTKNTNRSTSGWRLDPQHALEAAVNPNNNNHGSSRAGSVSSAALPAALSSGDISSAEADSSSPSYVTDFTILLAAGLELQRVKSYGDSKQSTSFRALFANGLNALFTERAVLYAEDARCRTLLLGSSKRDPNPLTFRAADLVSAKEVSVPSLSPSTTALQLTFYVPGGGDRRDTATKHENETASLSTAMESKVEEGKADYIENNDARNTDDTNIDETTDMNESLKGLKSVDLIIESATVRTYLSTMLLEHAQAELLRRNNAHENRSRGREAFASVAMSKSSGDGPGNEEWFSVVRSLSGEDNPELDDISPPAHTGITRRNSSNSSGGGADAEVKTGGESSGGGGVSGGRNVMWASVDDEEDEDDDEDDDDLEHGRFGRFTLGDAAAFRLKSRYARSLAALPHATHGGGGSSVPWLLHARGGAQSWPLSGAATTAAAATTATATGATGAGSPWRPVQAHEVNAVHRVFAVMAELYENMLAAGLVDDAALQLVVHANAAAHHHLQGALADLTVVNSDSSSSPVLTVEAQASLAASANSFDSDASALTQGALNTSSSKGKEKSAARNGDDNRSGNSSKNNNDTTAQGWSSLLSSRANAVQNMKSAVRAAQYRGGAAAHPRERQARREACLEAGLSRGCDVFLASLPTPAGGIPTTTPTSGSSGEGNSSSAGGNEHDNQAHRWRQTVYDWMPVARPLLRLETYREVHTAVLAIAAFVRAHRDLPPALQTCRALRPVALQRITALCADVCSRACAKLQELALAFPLVVRTARVVALALDLAHLKALEVMRLHAARWLDASQAAALIAPLYHAQRGLHDAKYCFEVNRLVLGFDLNLNLLSAAAAAAAVEKQEQGNASAATLSSTSIGREDSMRALEVKADAAAAAASAWGHPVNYDEYDGDDDDDEAKTSGAGARLPVRVVLRGLDEELENLNGQEGDLVAYDEDTRMFTVQLESGAQVMELLKDHLAVPNDNNDDNDADSVDVSGTDAGSSTNESPASSANQPRGSQVYDPALHLASSLYLKGTDPSAPLSEEDSQQNDDDHNSHDESRDNNDNDDNYDNNNIHTNNDGDDDDESSIADHSIASGVVEFAVAARPMRESALKRLSMSMSRLAGRAQASRANEPKKKAKTASHLQQSSADEQISTASKEDGAAATTAAAAAEANFLSAVNSLAAEENELVGDINEEFSDEESLQLFEPEDDHNEDHSGGNDVDNESAAKIVANNEGNDGDRKVENDVEGDVKDNNNTDEAIVDESPSKPQRAAGEHFPRVNFEPENPEPENPPAQLRIDANISSTTDSHNSSSSHDADNSSPSSSSSLATPIVAAPARPVLAAPTRGKGKGGKGARGKGAAGPGTGKGGRLPIAMRSMSEGRPSADSVVSNSGGRGAGRGQGGKGKGKGGKGTDLKLRTASLGRPDNAAAAPAAVLAAPPVPVVEGPKIAAPPAPVAPAAAAKPKLTAAEQKVAKARQAKAKRDAASAAEAEAAQARAVKAASSGTD